MRKANISADQSPGAQGIASLLEGLAPRRREIIRPVLEQPRPYVLLSLRGVSRKLERDPATLLRTVRAMGFKRYRDFQRYLHDRSIAYSTSLDVMEQASPPKSGTAGLIVRSIDRDLDNLKQLRNSVDPLRVVEVAKKLYLARRVLVLGADMEGSLVTFLDYNLAMLGIDCVSALTAGQIIHRMRHVGKQDVVIAIAFGRGLRQTVEGTKSAHANGAYCVGISDSFLSPLVSYSDQFFVTSTERVSFADSYVAGMAFVNLLLVACANLRRRRTISLLRKAAQEQRSGYRWYSEQPPMRRGAPSNA
jgi:DNA-binding MurR/RpiR family transcriptional regulator